MTVSVAEKPLEKTISSLLSRHALLRIELLVSEYGIRARAYPQPYHPLVAVRQREALSAAAGKIGGTISMEQATQISTNVRQNPIAEVAHFETLSDAIKALTKELKALK